MIEISEVVSGDSSTIKDLLKKSYSVKSQHRIIGEWNYNSILNIDTFGVYQSSPSSFIKGSGYVDGKSKEFYDTIIDDPSGAPLDIETAEIENIDNNKYYSLYECFNQFRPSAGVAYLFGGNFDGTEIVSSLPSINELDNIPGSGVTPSVKPYLVGDNMKYKYWCSAAYGSVNNQVPGTTGSDNAFITADVNGQTVGRPYPFIVYTQEFWCNVITIKYQTHLGVPNRFYIDVLKKNGSSYNWVQVFNSTGLTNLPEKDSDGVLRIYRNTGSPGPSGVGTWEVLEGYEYPLELADFLVEGQVKFNSNTGESSLSSFDEEADKIIGVRLRVDTMTAPGIPFELIELSPRLAVDLTDYVEAFSCSTTIGDRSDGKITSNTVIGSGSITLSNTDGGFFNDNPDSLLYGAIGKNIEITAFQTFSLGSGSSLREYQIPIKKMYTENWNEEDAYTVSADLYDFMKVLQSQTVPPFLVHPIFKDAPLSFAVQTVMHSVGYTNIKFKDAGNDRESIQYFYTGENKTVAEVLDQICEATQSAIYIDSFGYLVVASKDKIMNRSNPDISWWMTTEDINIDSGTGAVSEVSYNSSPEDPDFSYASPTYLANIVNLSKDVTEPVNDGEVNYKVKSIRKRDISPDSPAATALRRSNGIKSPSDIVKFSAPLAVQSVWSIDRQGNEDSSEKVLAGGVYLQPIGSTRLAGSASVSATGQGFANSGYTDLNNYLSSLILSSESNVRSSLKVIRVGYITAAALRPYRGFLKIDDEIIQYNGIEYVKQSIDSAGNISNNEKRWIFSDSEYFDFIKNTGPRISTYPSGNVGIFMDFNISGFPDNPSIPSWNQSKSYPVVDDGRGMFNTTVSAHRSETEGIPLGWEREKFTAYGINKDNFTFSIRATNTQETFNNVGTVEWGGLVIKGNRRGAELDETSTGAVKTAYRAIKEDVKDLTDSKNFDDILKLNYAGDLVFQGIERKLNGGRTLYSLDLTTVKKRSKNGELITGYSAAAGMAIDFNKSNGQGYFIEFCSDLKNQDLESDGAPAVVALYKVYGSNNKIKMLKFQAVAPQLPRDTIQSIAGLSASSEMQKLTVVNKRRGYFEVYYNNKLLFKAIDNDPLRETNRVFVYVRGDTSAIFDRFVAVNVPPPESKVIKKYTNALTTGIQNEIVQAEGELVNYAKENVDIFDFGSNFHQLKKFKFTYDAFPVITTLLADLSVIGGEYKIEDFYTDSFGGYVVVSNTKGYPIILDSETRNGLQVFGVPLLDVATEKITVDNFLNNIEDSSELKNKIIESRRKYGRRSITVDNEYIQRPSDANKILEWIIKNSYERSVIANVDIFPNPLHEITDVVRVYSPRNNMPNKNYSISGIDYSINQNGPVMTVSVREIL